MRRGLGDDSGFDLPDGSDSYTPSLYPSTDELSLTPIVSDDFAGAGTLPGSFDVSGGASSGGGFSDFLKAIPLIGQTISSIVHPSAPGSTVQQVAPQTPVPGGQDYQSQQAYPNASGDASSGAAPAAPSGISAWLQNPTNMTLALVGGAVLIVLMSGSGGRR